MPGKGSALALLLQRFSGPGILVRRGRKWSSTTRGSRNLGGLFLGPSPGAISPKSKSASEVIGDSGDGFCSSMFENGSREFRIVEGEALGVDDGEDVDPVLFDVFTAWLVDGVKF